MSAVVGTKDAAAQIARRRRRTRLRCTALPTFEDTMKPKRGPASSSLGAQ